MAKKLGNLVLQVQMENKKLLGKLEQTEKRLKRFQRRTKKMGSQFASTIGTVMIPALTAFGALATRTFAEYEDKMLRVLAVSGATASEFEQMKDKVRELGASTRYTASQAAEGMQFLAMAGLNATESINALGGALQLALIGNVSMGQAADITTNVLRGFNLEIEDLTHVNDVLATAITNSNSNLEEMASALSKVAGFAPVMNQSLETMTAFASSLANVGIKGEEAGTAIKMFLANLTNPVGEGADVLKKYNIAIRNVDGSFRDAIQIMEDFQDRGVDISEIVELFGKRATPKMVAAMIKGTGEMRRFSAYLEVSEGNAELMAKTMDTSLVGSFKRLTSASQEAMMQLGDSALGGMLKGLTDTTTFLLTGENAKKGDSVFTLLGDGISAFVMSGSSLLVKLGDIMHKVWLGLKVFKSGFVIAIKTIGNKVLNFVADIIDKLKELPVIGKKLKDVDTTSLRDMFDTNQAEKDAVKAVSAFKTFQIRTFKEIRQDLLDQQNAAQNELDKLLQAQLEAKKKDLKAAEELAKKKEELDNIEKARAEEALRLELEKQARIAAKLEEIGYIMDAVDLKSKEMSAGLQAAWLAGEPTDKLINILERYQQAQKDLQTALKNEEPLKGHIDLLKNIGMEYDALVGKTDSLNEATDRLAKHGFKTMEESAEEFSVSMTKAMDTAARSMILEFEDIGDAFEQMGKRMLDTIAEVIYQQTVGNAIAEMGSGLFGGSPGIGGGFFGNIFGGLFADGGQPPMNKVSVVGEEGPELFVPNTRGTIVPNHELGGSGGTTIVQNISVHPDVPSTTRRIIFEQLPMIKEAAAAGVEQKVLRGGQYANNIRGQ